MVLISLVSVLNRLYFYISTFRSMCAVPNMAVFWSSLTLCFLGMLLTYFLNDFEIVPVAPVITGITFVFTFHMRCISIVMSLFIYYYIINIIVTKADLCASIRTTAPKFWGYTTYTCLFNRQSNSVGPRCLAFWRRNYYFFNFSTPVYKMWIIQEPNMLELWNKLHFEEKKTERIYHV